MTTREEFIQTNIIPTLANHVDEFDVEAICDEVATFDESRGYVWKPEYDWKRVNEDGEVVDNFAGRYAYFEYVIENQWR